jgi:hypothetical protein
VIYLFVAGGLGLALCDQMHVQAGVLAHEAPGPFGQGWWVAPMFGVASVVIVVVARRFAPGSPSRPRQRLTEGKRGAGLGVRLQFVVPIGTTKSQPSRTAGRGAGTAEVAIAAAVFVAAYAGTALFSEDHPYLLAAALWLLALARLARSHERSRLAAFALLLAIAGPLVEFVGPWAG